jgi:hypothetical protein
VSAAPPDADLIAAIFERARLDGLAPLDGTTSRIGTKKRPRDLRTSLHDALEAWVFLTEPQGEWAEHRNWLAGLMGVSGDIIRDEAIRQGPSRSARIALAKQMRARGEEAPEPRRALPPGRPYTAPRWTAEDDAKLLQMRATGFTRKDIATALDQPFKRVARRIATLGLANREQPRVWTPEEDALLASERALGRTTREIAMRLGRSVRAIQLRVEESKLPRHRAGRKAA